MLISLSDFIPKYTGQPNVGDTPENIGECVGLIEVYNDECFRYPHIWGNAKDLLANADPKFFDREYNDITNLTQVPPIGAIMVWDGTWGSGKGHTGILVTAIPNSTVFTCFEENNPVGHAPEINMHINYAGVLGWLVPHPLPVQPSASISPSSSVSGSRSPSSSTSASVSPSASISPSPSPSPSAGPIEPPDYKAIVQVLAAVIKGPWHWFGSNGWSARLYALRRTLAMHNI
jgi:hypothetical protein